MGQNLLKPLGEWVLGRFQEVHASFEGVLVGSLSDSFLRMPGRVCGAIEHVDMKSRTR